MAWPSLCCECYRILIVSMRREASRNAQTLTRLLWVWRKRQTQRAAVHSGAPAAASIIELNTAEFYRNHSSWRAIQVPGGGAHQRASASGFFPGRVHLLALYRTKRSPPHAAPYRTCQVCMWCVRPPNSPTCKMRLAFCLLCARPRVCV